MRRRSAVLLASVAAAATATGCGGGAVDSSGGAQRANAAVSLSDYVASPTLGRGTAERLFEIPDLGRFRASCAGVGEARISYRAERGGASQVVTVQTARGGGSSTRVDPGERVSARIGASGASRSDWQVGLLTEGRIAVLTASFTVGRMGEFGCFVTGTAHTAKRRR